MKAQSEKIFINYKFTKMINSTANPKIKNILKLAKSKERKAQGVFIVEGHREIMMAVKNAYIITELYYCQDYIDNKTHQDTVPALLSFSIGPKAFERITVRNNPDGFLAVVKIKEHSMDDIKLSKNPLLIIVEAMEKPGNLGAILRTADAAGADGVIICEERTDIYNPNVIRASLGTVFSVPLAIISNELAYKFLRENNIDIFASSPSAENFYFEADLTRPAAILVGAEHEGLSGLWLKKADKKIRIPMKGQIDSLNASVSAAIIIYEALRQRQIEKI
jgi:TrmH family RNA methyltransferase